MTDKYRCEVCGGLFNGIDIRHVVFDRLTLDYHICNFCFDAIQLTIRTAKFQELVRKLKREEKLKEVRADKQFAYGRRRIAEGVVKNFEELNGPYEGDFDEEHYEQSEKDKKSSIYDVE